MEGIISGRKYITLPLERNWDSIFAECGNREIRMDRILVGQYVYVDDVRWRLEGFLYLSGDTDRIRERPSMFRDKFSSAPVSEIKVPAGQNLFEVQGCYEIIYADSVILSCADKDASWGKGKAYKQKI
jgi:hypothetical protein